MSIKHLLLILMLSAATMGLKAQQDAEYSMYMFNGLVLNPAYAGSKEAPTAMAIYRHQWAELEGAPRSFNISSHSPFKRHAYALGGTLHYDQLGQEKKYKADIDFAFRIPIKHTENKISIGIRAGLLYYHVQPENYRPLSTFPLDPTLEENYKTFIPNIGFGIHATGKRYYVGISLPHLLNLSLKEEGGAIFADSTTRKFRHLFVTAGGVLGSDYGKVKVKPSVLYKYSPEAPWDFDINISLLFIDRLWIGASYRTGGDSDDHRGESIVGILKFKASKDMEIGYAYDHTLSRLGGFNNGTHEVMLGFDFGNRSQKIVAPRYFHYF